MTNATTESAPASLLRTICGVQTHVTFADTAANLDRMLTWLAHPDVQGADLVVFPECMLTGYCFSSLEEAIPHTQSIAGPATEAIARVCR
ncbi:MAG: carbon-nitrogen hydrolase family protein, partial [Pirellula sp.]